MSERSRRRRSCLGAALGLALLALGCRTLPPQPAAIDTVGAQPATRADGAGHAGRASPATDPATSGAAPERAGALPAVARLPPSARAEVSGLAVSRTDDRRLWAINDSGNGALLHAFDRAGRPLGDWPLAVPNRDWEDLAALRLDGRPFLLIADTGDNLRRRADYALHLVAEPVPGTTPENAPLAPSLTIRFRYEDGAHDVEAVAVDETDGVVWLLTKEAPQGARAASGGVYRLPLAQPTAIAAGHEAVTDEADAVATIADGTVVDENLGGAARVARRVATLADVPRGLESRLAATLVGVDLEQVTAFDIAADGRVGCLSSYRHLRCFGRREGEGWADALARPADGVVRHALAQAEALALSPDGLVWLTSEGSRAPLKALPLPLAPP